ATQSRAAKAASSETALVRERQIALFRGKSRDSASYSANTSPNGSPPHKSAFRVAMPRAGNVADVAILRPAPYLVERQTVPRDDYPGVLPCPDTATSARQDE